MTSQTICDVCGNTAAVDEMDWAFTNWFALEIGQGYKIHFCSFRCLSGWVDTRKRKKQEAAA